MPLKVAIRIGQNVFKADGEFDFDVDFWTTLAMWLEALHEPDDSLPDSAAVKLDHILAQGQELLMGAVEMKATLARIRSGLDNLAADLRRIKDHIHLGMTPEEVADVQGELDTEAARVEGLAGETPEDPPAPPAPPAA